MDLMLPSSRQSSDRLLSARSSLAGSSSHRLSVGGVPPPFRTPRGQTPAAAAKVALLTALLLSLSGCVGCPPPIDTDAGVDAGTEPDVGPNEPSPPLDGGNNEPEGDASTGPLCNEDVEGYGEACAAQDGDPLCGEFICNPQTDELFCYDLGPNACGGCEELDLSAGRVGEPCGEFGCGVVVCSEDLLSTQCEGDRPRNQCGGCADILPLTRTPGDVCSICGTGEQTCTRDENNMLCVGGRAPNNACGGCDRCILSHAFMDDRFGGGFIRTGTTVIVEDIGDGVTHLVFDPLIEGPGTGGLVLARVYFSNQQNPAATGANAAPLAPDFAQALIGVTADPIRQYTVPPFLDPGGYRYVVVYDELFQNIISVGELRPGAPPEVSFEDGGLIIIDDGGVVDDGGFIIDDGGVLDAGRTDAGEQPDASSPDAGAIDAGAVVDAGAADAGAADAGAADAGAADAGATDAGATDGGAADAG